MNALLKAGVIGWPISHSLSPRLHGYWLKQYGIAGSYDALPVEPAALAETLRDLPDRGFRGVNLTVPHKEAALALMDRLDPLARQAGAVNTVIVGPDGRLEGRNTDVFGCAENLRRGGDKGGYIPQGRPVVLIGAGGAARAAVLALSQLGATKIRIMNRSPDRAVALREQFSGVSTPASLECVDWLDGAALRDAELVLNSTSLGMQGQPALDLPLDALPPDAVVSDMVYAPLRTDLLQRAAARGNPTIDGLGMLLHQARPAFKAFFGHDSEVTKELRDYISVA